MEKITATEAKNKPIFLNLLDIIENLYREEGIMSISFVLITFLFQMSVGMLMTVAILPPGLIDKNFFRSISFWAWFFTGIGLGLKHYATFRLPEIFATITFTGISQVSNVSFFIFALLCFQLWFRIRFLDHAVSKMELIIIAMVGFLAVVMDSLLFHPQLPPAWVHSLLIPLNFVTSTLMLGGFLAGMIFGHWYLVNTEMPKRLLVTMAWVLIVVLALRIVAVGSSLLLYKYVVYPHIDFLSSLTSFQGHGIFFWQRVLVGLAIPAVVVFMIHNTARIGSNQSATGIMYVAIAFVFIGELVARYLFLLSAIPL